MALQDVSSVEIDRALEFASGGGSSTERPPQLIAIQPEAVAQLLAPAVNQLFRVTLALASAAASSDEELAGRLLEAVSGIDAAIHQLRCSLLVQAA